MSKQNYQTGRVLTNVEYPVYCPMTDETTETYAGTVKAIAPVMSVNKNTESEDNDLHGDGIIQETETNMGKTTLEMQVNYLAMSVEADLRGHEYDETTGEMRIKDSDVTPYAAFGFMLQDAGGEYLGYWLLKGKLQEPNLEVQQKEGATTNYSTPTLTVSGVTRRSDGMREIHKKGTRDEIIEWLSTAETLAPTAQTTEGTGTGTSTGTGTGTEG